jgi:hypothetical protein
MQINCCLSDLHAVHCVKRGNILPYIGPHIVKNCKVKCYVRELSFVICDSTVSIRHGATPVCGWRLRSPHMEVASNMLNKQSPTTYKGLSSLSFDNRPKTVHFRKGNNLRSTIFGVLFWTPEKENHVEKLGVDRR